MGRAVAGHAKYSVLKAEQRPLLGQQFVPVSATVSSPQAPKTPGKAPPSHLVFSLAISNEVATCAKINMVSGGGDMVA